jgi:hypothetical protein
MPTLLLLWGIAAFTATLGAHIAVWQLVRPRREMLWLFVLFLLLPVVVAVVAVVYGGVGVLEGLAVWLLHAALSVAYVQTYPAIREEIPSFRILLAISAAGKRGLSRDEVLSLFEGSTLFADKMTDLDNDGLLHQVDGRLRLTRAGRLIALVFHRYRRLLGLESGLG